MDRPPSRLFERLKRRKVVQWSVAYLSAAWLVLQVVDVVGEQFAWPGALGRGITVALGFGLLGTLVVAWFHGEKGHQRVTRTETLLLVTVAFFGAGALLGTISAPDAAIPGSRSAGAADPGIPLDEAAVAVLPFAPTAADSALERLGRDLAITLAATLDGIDDLRTVDGLTILAHLPADSAVLSLPRARALAARLGAGRLLRGTLSRQADGVRVDAALHGASGAALARATVTLDSGAGLGPLTDSLTLALLGRLWSRPTAELPSTAALATRSADALRAYVEGEEALAAGEMVRAVLAFERAFAHDSTFLFAYWRSLYPRIYEGSSADTAILARIYDRRHELPPPDRMLVEARTARTVSEELTILEEATRRFPTHWPAWYTLANLRVHNAPYIGADYRDAREALERVLALNPGFGSAWEHLFWIVTHQRDTAATREILDRLRTFGHLGGFRFDQDLEMYYGATRTAVAGGGRFDPAAKRATAEYIRRYSGPIPPSAFGVGLLIMGLPRATVQLTGEVLELAPGAALTASMWRGQAYGWTGRGAWDSAAVAVDRWLSADASTAARIAGYGLLASGAALGATAPAAAERVRPHPMPDDATPDQRAELAWADGIVAYARGDTAAIDRAHARVARSGGDFAPLLAASLQAMHLHAGGQPRAAIDRLLAAEDSAGEHWVPHRLRHVHPHIATVDRVLLGRWLLDAGRPADAARRLRWYGAVHPGNPALEVVNRTVGILGIYERARAEEAIGSFDDASVHYRRFIEAMDRPVESLRRLVRDARVRQEALEPRLRG